MAGNEEWARQRSANSHNARRRFAVSKHMEKQTCVDRSDEHLKMGNTRKKVQNKVRLLRGRVTSKEQEIEVFKEEVRTLQYQAMVKQLQYNSLYQQSNAKPQRKKKALQDAETAHQLEIEHLTTSVDKRSTPGHLQSLFDGYAPGRGKWKSTAIELFKLNALKDSLIDQSVFHIKDNVSGKTSSAYTVDMYHGVNLSGIDNASKIEASSNGRCLLWSSGSVKGAHRHIEKEMQKEIKFDIINDLLGLNLRCEQSLLTLSNHLAWTMRPSDAMLRFLSPLMVRDSILTLIMSQ
jgi:hypothetical protein